MPAQITKKRKVTATVGPVGKRPKPASKRPRVSPSPSSSGSGSDDDDAPTDKASMLAALQAHSRALLGMADEEDQPETSSMAQKRAASSDEDDDDDDDEEMSDDGWGAGVGMVSDSEDEFAAGASQAKPIAVAPLRVPEVVFDETNRRSSEQLSKSERRAFLNGTSAKIMSLPTTSDLPSNRKPTTAADAEDATNSSLDKTLHSLLTTSLLSSHTLNSASRPVEKRDAVSSRLLQLAGYALPGETFSPAAESKHKGHSAKIKTGIQKAGAKRQEKERQESEMAGSWVKGKGGLSDLGRRGDGVGGIKKKEERLGMGEEKKKKGMERGGKERDRGLGVGVGVGRFDAGVLRVSEREIGRVERMGGGGRGGGRGRGGRGGRGGGGRGRGGGGRGRGGVRGATSH